MQASLCTAAFNTVLFWTMLQRYMYADLVYKYYIHIEL